MRKKQRIIYSSITGMLVCAFVLMAVIMVKNSKTVSALNISDAMQMDTYNKLHEIKDTDTNLIICDLVGNSYTFSQKSAKFLFI